MYPVRKLFHPELYQGKYKRRGYFEGWYFKLIDSRLEHALAVIPGVSIGGKGDSHAFVQVLDSFGRKVRYLKYDIAEFRYDEKQFQVEIGENRFSDREIRLKATDGEFAIEGSLMFQNTVPFPKTLRRPGIMGPFSFVPFMECYHGIVSIHHDIAGCLNISGLPVNFDEGYGYIEKDWGRSFPEAWIWLQSNHFDAEGVSLMFSTAKIPWLGRYFTGFLSFLRIGPKMYLFATYTRAAVKRLEYRDNRLVVSVEDREFRLEIEAEHTRGGILKAPKNGLMSREVLESIDASVWVRLSEREGKTVFEGRGSHTGLEIMEEIFRYYH